MNDPLASAPVEASPEVPDPEWPSVLDCGMLGPGKEAPVPPVEVEDRWEVC